MVKQLTTEVPVEAAPVEEQVGYTFTLPGGLRMNGQVLREVVMDEMTGVDEERIANPGLAGNGGKIMTALLTGVVKSIGGKPVTSEMIRNLFIGDRDFLMLKLRIITSGNEYPTQADCPKCNAKLNLVVNLDDLEIKKLDDGKGSAIPFTLTKGYRDTKGAVHKEGTLKLPTGIEQEFLSSEGSKNMAVATTHLITSCCTRLGDLDMITNEVIRKLTTKDREMIAMTLRDNMPGPVMEFDISCTCGNKWTSPIAVADFFATTQRS